MSYPSGYSYSSPSAPSSSSCPPQIGFKTTIANTPISNMSGYPSYPNQGGVPPAYPPTSGYSPYSAGQQQQAYSSPYPASSPAYPSYPPASSAAPYGSSPYPTPQSAGGYAPSPYAQPQGYGQPAIGYSSGYPSQPGYPSVNPTASYPSMQQQQPGGYMSQAQPGGPQYPGMSQQPQYQNYAQSYGAPGVPPSAAHNPYYPGSIPYSTSSPYSSSSPYSTSTAGGYNIANTIIEKVKRRFPFPI